MGANEVKTVTIKTRIKQRRDTSANWESKNPVLLNGEVIIVDTANSETRTKTGDGTKTYTQLPFDDEGAKGGKSLVDENKVLFKDNNVEYIPTADYHPATKKYVDSRSSSKYIFSDQFNVDGDYVAINGSKENTKINIVEALSNGIQIVSTPTDLEACVTYTGNGDVALLNTGTSTQIISSKSGKLISLPKGIAYTEGMDVSSYDSVDILSLHKNEYVDKEGKVYTYKNINALANGTINANYSAMGRDSSKNAISTPVDGLTAICFRRDATGYNGYSAIYNYWKENEDVNGAKYYQFRSTGYGFEKNDGSWSVLTDFVYPQNDGETAFCYASFPDNEGNLIQFKSIDYSTFLTTKEDNVCALKYINASKGVMFFFKPKADYGYNVDGTTLKVGTTAVNNAWLVIKTREVEYEKTINNKIKTYAGGSLIFIPDENLSVYASDPVIELNTIHYSLELAEDYEGIQLGEVYEGQSGILKHKVVAGLTKGLGSNILTNDIIKQNKQPVFPSVVGTQGVLSLTQGQSLLTEELFGYGSIFEEQTQESYVKKFSDEIILKGDWLYRVSQIESSNGSLWEFRIPLNELQETPAFNATSTAAVVLNSAYRVVSEDSLRAMTTFAYNTYGLSFSYTEEAEYVTIVIAQNYVYGDNLVYSKKAVDDSQLKIKYLLANFEYKYNVDKLFIENGDSVSFDLKTDKVLYKNIELIAPKNNRAAINMLKPITMDLNDLNYKIENVKAIATASIGKGDGRTDDTQALQKAIDSAKTEVGVVSSIIIPSGHYLVSAPLVISEADTIIRGEGEVVIEAASTNYRLPLIVVKANDVTIENLTLKLGYCADDPQYTAGYNKLTDIDPEISHVPKKGLHCGIWIDNGKNYNNIINNEALNAYSGYYRTNVKDVVIIGGYRYSVKKLERSYGIYVPDGGYNYFNRLENIKLFNLYCGIRLGEKSSSTYVDFHFDNDLNNRGGTTSTNIGGCRFGLISRAWYGNITCYGQMLGGDAMPPIYYDENGNEKLMANSTKVTKQVVDKQTLELVDNVYTTEGWQDGIMTYPTLTETGLVIYGRNNYIYNMNYDSQRASNGLVYFDVDSAYNEVFLPTGSNLLYGANETTYNGEKYYRTVIVDNAEYYDVVYYNVSTQNYIDLGTYNKRRENTIENRELPFVGDRGVWARTDSGQISRTFSKNVGMQDNFLSFVDKWGTVTVKQNDTVISTFETTNKSGKIVEVNSLAPIFATNVTTTLNGFATGITFKEVPTKDSPIVIDIVFDTTYTALSSGFILFNDYIAKSYSICLLKQDTLEEVNPSRVYNNHNAMVYYKPYNNSNDSYLKNSNCKGLRIKIFEGLTWTTADSNGVINSEGKVGISYIFMANANAGGKSYLSKGGGNIYGDLIAEVNGKVHKLTEKTNSSELSAVATSGKVADLVQEEGEVIIFDCGNATTYN